MKKLIGFITIILSLMMIFSSYVASAEYYSNSEVIDIKLENLSDCKTVSKKDAAFSVCIELKEKTEVNYEISYIINEKTYNCGVLCVKPYEKFNKKFSLNLPYGKHNINIIVKRNNMIVKELITSICVTDGYIPQFMDEYNKVGVNTHFGHQVSNDLTKPWNMNVLKYLKFAGITRIRDGFVGAYLTTKRNNFDMYGTTFSKNPKWFMEGIKNSGLSVYMTNMFYPLMTVDSGGDSGAPQSQVAIEHYKKAIDYIVRNVPGGDKEVCFWNEPNIASQWKPQNGKADSDYANLAKQAALTAYSINPDIKIHGFTNAVFDTNFMETGFQKGMYKYITGIDYHKYCQQDDPESMGYAKFVKANVEDLSIKYGGWLEKIASEVGVSQTYTTTEDLAAQRMFKDIIVLDEVNVDGIYIYDFVNDGTDFTNSEHNYGMLTADHTPKKQYLSVIQYNNELAGAIFLGKIDLGIEDSWAYLYLKDGKPKLVAWIYSPDGSKKASLNVSGLTARDIYGNVISKNAESVTLTMDPYIIDGLSIDYMAMTIYQNISNKHKNWLEAYESKLPENVIQRAKDLFSKTETAYKSTLNEEETRKIIDEYFSLGLTIIEEGSNKTISELLVSQSLYELYRIIEHQMGYYIGIYQGDFVLSSNLNEVKRIVNAKYRDSQKIMQYSDKIYRFGKDYHDIAINVLKMDENPQKNGVITGYSMMADGLFSWVGKFTEFEPVENYGYTIQIPGYDLLSYVNENKSIKVTLKNSTNKDSNGKLVVYDEDGELVYESKSIFLKKNSYVEHPIKIRVPESKNEEGTIDYRFCLIDNVGNIIVEDKYVITAQKSIDVSILSVMKEPKELDTLKIKIKNNRTEQIDFDFIISSSEELMFGTEKTTMSLKAGAEEMLEIPIVRVENTKFHFYPISYKAIDGTGATIAKADTMLNFTCIAKAKQTVDVAKWNGEVDDWYDAYPIYINTPADANSKKAWNNSDLAARLFMKWDQDNFYILSEVYDDIHNQNYENTSIWQGDSVQLGIDPFNEGGAKYTSNIYELGISKNEFQNSFWCWNGDAKYDEYEKLTKIIRDEESHTTKYLMVIPKATLSRLDLKENTIFGFNFALNDCDVLSRDLFMEYTLGLASSKNPSLWEDFILLGEGTEQFVEGRASDVFN